MEWYEYWKSSFKLAFGFGLGKEKYRLMIILKLAHYANAACDIEHQFPFGLKN